MIPMSHFHLLSRAKTIPNDLISELIGEITDQIKWRRFHQQKIVRVTSDSSCKGVATTFHSNLLRMILYSKKPK